MNRNPITYSTPFEQMNLAFTEPCRKTRKIIDLSMRGWMDG